MRLAGFLLSSPLAFPVGFPRWPAMLAWHAGLACWPHPTGRIMAKFGALIDASRRCFPLFLPLIDAFPAPIDAPFTNFSPHQSLIDALFTYACAIAHRQVNTSSIRD